MSVQNNLFQKDPQVLTIFTFIVIEEIGGGIMPTQMSKENQSRIRDYLKSKREEFKKAGIAESRLDSATSQIIHRYANGEERSVSAQAILHELDPGFSQ